MNGMNLLMDAARAAHAAGGGGGSGQWDNSAGMGKPAQPPLPEPCDPEILAARLDEAARFIGRYVHATKAQIDAMVLLAAQTHVLDVLVTTCRALWTAEREESGKTLAMLVTAALSSNPYDTTGTSYSLQSKLAGNDSEGCAALTLYRDEISSVFGQAGTGGNNNPLADILRKGYKKGAKSSWSVNRVNVDFPIFGTFLMTGLRTSVPRDIRSRCIVFRMEPGRPELYFDAREGEALAAQLAASLSAAVKGRRDAIGAFRGRGLHPKLNGRRLEIWEGMFAVSAAASQEWLNRCMTAFCELALDESDQPVLSPEQTIVRDVAAVLDGMELDAWHGREFAGGLALCDELKRLDSELYAQMPEVSLARMVSDALPFRSQQCRLDGSGERVRGYFADDLRQAWDSIAPAPISDVELPEEPNPFDVDDSDITDVTDVTRDSEDEQ